MNRNAEGMISFTLLGFSCEIASWKHDSKMYKVRSYLSYTEKKYALLPPVVNFRVTILGPNHQNGVLVLTHCTNRR